MAEDYVEGFERVSAQRRQAAQPTSNGDVS